MSRPYHLKPGRIRLRHTSVRSANSFLNDCDTVIGFPQAFIVGIYPIHIAEGAKEPKYEFTLPRSGTLRHGWRLEVLKESEDRSVGADLCCHYRRAERTHNSHSYRMITFLERRDYAEYLDPTERPPVHLLCVLNSDAMRTMLIEKSPVAN